MKHPCKTTAHRLICGGLFLFSEKVFIDDNQLSSSYNIQDFFEACQKQSQPEADWEAYVFVDRAAMISAKIHFNFPTSIDIVNFFSYRPDVKFQSTKIQENNHDGTQGKDIDGYTFKIDNKSVYFAFVFNPNSQKWRIKSFKPDNNQIMRTP